MATKLDRLVKYNEEFPLIKLHDRGFVKSHYKLNILYLHVHITNRDQYDKVMT